MLAVSTYTPVSGRKSARITNGVRTVLITQDRPGVWVAWYSDSTRTLTRGSFRQCVTVARRKLAPAPVYTHTGFEAGAI